MNLRINTLFPTDLMSAEVDVFGYTTKGIPGIEIIGLGARGRTMKEKFVYLTRLQPHRLPMKRFVLCVESNTPLKELSHDKLRWLELPLLLVFWSMAGIIPISRLEDCFCGGKISVSGKITPLSESELNTVPDKFISLNELGGTIPLDYLLEKCRGISFERVATKSIGPVLVQCTPD